MPALIVRTRTRRGSRTATGLSRYRVMPSAELAEIVAAEGQDPA
ncbi:MAG: hypothetical protein ACLPUO_09410 [Streptosporangiaceae bacterium]